MLAGGDHQRRVASIRVNDAGKAIAGAGDRVQIHEGGLVRCHCVAEGHSSGCALVQAENVAEVRGHILQEREFARAGVAKNAGHAQIAQDLVGCLSHCGHFWTPIDCLKVRYRDKWA